jgi:outer membrane immunogenic protein
LSYDNKEYYSSPRKFMNLKLAPLFISLALLSGNALADHVIKTLVPTEVRKSYDGLLVAMAATALDAPEERHDWTGLYVGGFAGGSSGTKITTAGPADYNTANPTSHSYKTNSGAMGGGTVGYNWQLGRSPYVVGIEGELGYLGTQGRAVDSDGGNYGYDSSHKTKIGGSYGYGLIGGRIGYAYKRSLFFVKGGAVFVKSRGKYTDSCIASPCGGATLNASGRSTQLGYGIGAGIEHVLPEDWFEQAKNISIKVEYLYLGIERTQNIAGLASTGYNFSTSARNRGIHTAKIGINYHFDGF